MTPTATTPSISGPSLSVSVGRAGTLMVAAEGLMAKLHELHRQLEGGDRGSDSFWRAGVLPDLPKLCTYLSRKFPEPPGRLLENGSLERTDKSGLDMLRSNADAYRESLEPWYLMYVDLMLLRHEAVRVLLDINTHLALVSLHQNGVILTTFMNLVCVFVRVNMLADKTPKKMLVQVYSLVQVLASQETEAPHYYQLCQFFECYDPTMKGLQLDLHPIGPRIGEVLESVALVVFQLQNIERVRSEGLLQPVEEEMASDFGEDSQMWGGSQSQSAKSVGSLPGSTSFALELPRAKRQTLVAAALRYDEFLNWIVWGYLVCPEELLAGNGTTIVLAALRDCFVGTLFRELHVFLHEEYEVHVVSKLREIAKNAKATRQRHTSSEARYQAAKIATMKIGEASEIARLTADASHRLRRTFLKQEISQVTLMLEDEPARIGASIQGAMAALVLARSEVLWYFSHVGVPFMKTRSGVILAANHNNSNNAPVNLDLSDPTVGFLLDGIIALSSLIQKHAADVQASAEVTLRATVVRIQSMLEIPSLTVLDTDVQLRRQLSTFWESLLAWGATSPTEGPSTPRSSWTLADVRSSWISIIAHLSSVDSYVSLRQLEELTDMDSRSSLVSEGNHLFHLSRFVDELPDVLAENSSLKHLCFFRPQLSQLFRQTMFGPEGRPQHCCAWLKICTTFPQNAHKVVTTELARLNKLAVECMESLMESIVSGIENLITILDSDIALGGLDNKLAPTQAATRMNLAARAGQKSRAAKRTIDIPLPGYESQQANKDFIKTMEAAIQRLTSVCSTIGRMEPVQVVNEIFDPKAYLRERIASLFRTRLLHALVVDNELQRPTVLESELKRLMAITNLVEAHTGLDVARSLREVLLSEAYEGRLRDRAPRSQARWKAIDVIADWYLESIVRDTRGAGVVFAPLESRFRSTRTGVGVPVELVADASELEALVRVFGPYGCDKMESILLNQLKELMMKLEVVVRLNMEAFQHVQKNMHQASERNKCRTRTQDVDIAMATCIQIGQCLTLRDLFAKATGKALRENVPMLLSSLEGVNAGLPHLVPETSSTLMLRRVAGLAGATADIDDAAAILEVLKDLGTSVESYWSLLPILYAMMMMSPTWRFTLFNASTGSFNNNANCLARCIHATIAGAEYAEAEEVERQREAIRQIPVEGPFRPPPSKPSPVPAPIAIATRVQDAMQRFVACASVMVLGSAWDEDSRGPAFAARMMFMDHLAETSKYPIRNLLEEHLPYSILRGVLRHEYDASKHDELTAPMEYAHQRRNSLSRTTGGGFTPAYVSSGRARTYSSGGRAEEVMMMSADETHAPAKSRRSSTIRHMFSSGSRRSSYDGVGGGDKQLESTADSGEVHSASFTRRRSLSTVIPSCTAVRSPPDDNESPIVFSGPLPTQRSNRTSI